MIMKSINYRIWYLCFSIFILSACSGGGDLDDLLNKPTQNTTDNNGNNGDNNGDNNSAYITVVSSLSFDSGSSSKSVNITSNVAWSYECYESWVTVKKDSPSQMTVSVSANASSERWAYIYFKEDGKSTNLASLIVKQSSAEQTPSSLTFTVNGVSFKMIKVEGGTFTMGATSEQGSDAHDDEKPAHKVTLSTYYISETLVTEELYGAINGYSSYKGSLLPAGGYSYNSALKFIEKLNSLTGKNFRLPTEAEWEFAARGGNKSLGYKYSGSNSLDEVGWYDENSNLENKVVASKKANELGIYDMSGLFWEICQDIYGPYSGVDQTNPKGPSSGKTRVQRGGAFNFGKDGGAYHNDLFRVSARHEHWWGDSLADADNFGGSFVGIRLVLSN